MIGLSQIEFYILLAGWIFTAILGMIVFFYIKFTPAKVFLKAFLSKTGVAECVSMGGISEFREITNMEKGYLEVKGLGNVMQTPNSHLLDKKAKVPIFTCFSNYGYSVDKNYSCIIQELKEKGLNIQTYEDYIKYLILARDDRLFDNFLEQDKLTKNEIKIVKEIREKGIDLKTYKTYNTKDLFHMFPNNVNVDIVEAKIIEEVNRQKRKDKSIQQNLIYIAMAVLIIVVAVVIFLKVYKTPEPVIQIIDAGIERINQTINYSM